MANSKKSYNNITQSKIDTMLVKLKENGASVSGNNPWKINVNKFSIKLIGKWQENDSKLTIEIADKRFFVLDSMIWGKIDPLIRSM